MKQPLHTVRALADEIRMRAWKALEAGELCLCELIELLDRSPATVSRHLSLLRQAGLIEYRKEGRWHYYGRAKYAGASARMLRALDRMLDDDDAVRSDKKRLNRIQRKSREELCQCYRRK